MNVEEYRYDYAGNRIAKIGELSTTYYLVNTNGALSQVLAEYDENSSLKTYYTRGEELISQERNGAKSYYLYDGFDSVRMLTDEDGTATDFYTYDAFGNLTEQVGDTENSYLYRGEQYDSFTGLYYLRARYMNPSTGTFITMDEYSGSVFEPVSLHKYLYANANPVMYSDPSGYESIESVTTATSGLGILAQGLSTAANAAARVGLRILSMLLSPHFIIANTALLPLIATLGNICSDLLSGNKTSASICNDVKDKAKDDATDTDIDIAKSDPPRDPERPYHPAYLILIPHSTNEKVYLRTQISNDNRSILQCGISIKDDNTGTVYVRAREMTLIQAKAYILLSLTDKSKKPYLEHNVWTATMQDALILCNALGGMLDRIANPNGECGKKPNELWHYHAKMAPQQHIFYGSGCVPG